MPKPYEKNAKKHSSEQLFKIARSIKEFGWRQPIVCDKDDVIIVGHGRYWAYEKYKNDMKLPEPRIEVAEDLTDEQVKAYRLADNLTASTEYDMDLVNDELPQLGLEFQDIFQLDLFSTTAKAGEEERFINNEAYEKYQTQSIRQIVCLYQQQEYNELMEMCEALYKKFGIENNSELFKKLVTDRYAEENKY